MELSNHAKKRLIQRHKEASYMRKNELNELINSAEEFNKECGRDHGFKAAYYLIESINLVLVVNPETSLIVTCYEGN